MRLLTNGMKIGNATVVVDIIKKGNPEIRPGTAMSPKKITTHNTGNAGRGANAEMHNRYIHNLASYHPKDTSHVSWHLSVDDKFIYQHIPFDEIAWHCGDGNGVNSGNRTSIGIEICENPETNTKQAEENAIALTVLLMKEFKLKPTDVVPHQHWSGKYCPRVILNRDKSFTPYRNRVTAALSEPVEEKEVDEMTQQLPQTQKNDMKVLLAKAYKDKVFSVDHTSKVDTMTRGEANDLLISYVARTK